MATPEVTSISPSGGANGTTVTISGNGFTGTIAVNFGSVAAASFNVNGDGEVTAPAPAPVSSGSVDVTVTTPDGTSATSAADAFTYTAVPTVTAVNPATGIAGTVVTVTGTAFTGTSQVTFGSNAGSAVNVVIDTELNVAAPAAAASGPVDVVVTAPGGTSAGSAADQFTYNPVPVVSAIAPSSGQTGTVVTVTGSGFTGATSVAFGTIAGTSLSVVSDTQLTVAAPAPNASGMVDLTVTTPNGTSVTTTADQFTYNPVPVVTSINPTGGNPGITVTVSGAGFTGATSVTFGGVAGSGLNVTSDTALTIVAPPPNAAGAVDVIVTTPTGISAASPADQFTFSAVPVVTGIAPTTGPAGTVVTVTGANFTGATAVAFGATPGTALAVGSDTQVTITAPPPVASGAVDVTVTTPSGTSTTGGVDQFTYVPVPIVSGITPVSGAAGTVVTISGTGFTGATAVSFGANAGTGLSVASDTQITITAPAATPPGTAPVDVTVTTPVGRRQPAYPTSSHTTTVAFRRSTSRSGAPDARPSRSPAATRAGSNFGWRSTSVRRRRAVSARAVSIDNPCAGRLPGTGR